MNALTFPITFPLTVHSEAELLSLAGAINSARRKTRAAGPGKPRTAPRCPCGAMTVARALARNHRCLCKETS